MSFKKFIAVSFLLFYFVSLYPHPTKTTGLFFSCKKAPYHYSMDFHDLSINGMLSPSIFLSIITIFQKQSSFSHIFKDDPVPCIYHWYNIAFLPLFT